MTDSPQSELTLRDKDIALAQRCNAAAQAASDAVTWLAQNRDPSPSIANLQRDLRRQTVEARRLGTAAARPMSVGVFGASQMGKSFLIGSLIAPKDRSIAIVFGEGENAVRQDFLQEINPAGGDETTGLVTRFSLRSYKTPAGNPVVLRLLREVDIAKILANSFRFDLKGSYRIKQSEDDDTVDDRTPNAARIEALVDRLRPMRKAELQPGFSLEDVFELRDYVEKHLDDHYLGLETGESYWTLLEDLLPHLDAEGRKLALAPLWAELEEFTDLYGRLKVALDQLGHPFRAYTALSALADRSRGVLHVNTLRDLDEAGAVETLSVVTDNGINATLPTCVVTALTAELCVTLDEPPWDFFTNTDLLDFPGARSRENKTVAEFLRNPEEPKARSNCFLRGKVALLFDNYAADLDLNLMLLCAGPENQEVKSLQGLVGEWIARTHGATPAERQGRPTGLFYCLTKCDTLFVKKVGQENPVRTRLENNLGPYPWTDEWVPGRPFDNIHLIRNPEIMDPGLFTYEAVPEGAPDGTIPPETGLTPDFQAQLNTSFRPMYSGEDLVKRHIGQSDQKLDALLATNDGGTTLLAEALAQVCNPDIKYDQVLPRADRAIHSVTSALTGFYETGDIAKRVAERTARIEVLIEALKAKRQLIGPFIASFQVDQALMEAAYRDYRRLASDVVADAGLWDDDVPDEPAAADGGFGAVIVEWWAKHLMSKAGDPAWPALLEIDSETVRAFVEEIVTGAERAGVGSLLMADVDHYTQSTMALDDAARRISIFAALAMNDEVNFPGRRDEGGKARFARNAASPDALPEDPGALARIRIAYRRDWLNGLRDLTVANASWGVGGTVDVEANAQMGDILARLGWSE